MVEKSPLTTYGQKLESQGGYIWVILVVRENVINTKKTPAFCVFFLTWAFLKYPEEKVARSRFIVSLSLFAFVKRNSSGT